MRKLTTIIVTDSETLEPQLSLLLDGEETGVNMQIEVISDLRVLHGEDAVEAMIDMTLEALDVGRHLTKEEKKHFKRNLKSGIMPGEELNERQ